VNERIRELAFKSAGGMLSYDEDGFVLSEKEVNRFAELIVLEVFAVIEGERFEIYSPTRQRALEYFGIKEDV
jgi:hypothetical protein